MVFVTQATIASRSLAWSRSANASFTALRCGFGFTCSGWISQYGVQRSRGTAHRNLPGSSLCSLSSLSAAASSRRSRAKVASGPNADLRPLDVGLLQRLQRVGVAGEDELRPGQQFAVRLQLVVAQRDAGEPVRLAGLAGPLGLAPADQPRPGPVQEEVARLQRRVLLGLRLGDAQLREPAS